MNENPTLEEIKEQQKRMQAFYEENLPFLRIQHEHDTLLAEIEEARVRVGLARAQFTQMNAKSNPPDKKEGSSAESKEGK